MRKSFLSLFSAGARPSRHPGIPRQRIDATTENKGERLSCDSAGHGQGQRFSLPGLASGLCWSAGLSARFLFAGSVNVRCRAGRSGAAARRPRRALPSLLPGRLSSLSWARPPAGWGRARGPGALAVLVGPAAGGGPTSSATRGADAAAGPQATCTHDSEVVAGDNGRCGPQLSHLSRAVSTLARRGRRRRHHHRRRHHRRHFRRRSRCAGAGPVPG